MAFRLLKLLFKTIRNFFYRSQKLRKQGTAEWRNQQAKIIDRQQQQEEIVRKMP
jgi:hypothetical protein